MYKVYVTSDKWNDLDLITRDMTDEFEVEVVAGASPEEIVDKCKDADALLIGYETVTNEVMDALPNLKLIQFMAIGVEGIDLAHARSKNIAVANVPTYCLNEVADHALALILSINRRISQFNRSVEEGQWDIRLYPEITRLGESTVGLLGFGNIPRAVNKRLQAFGAKVIAYDPFLAKEVGEEHNVELVSLDELMERSDYISSHLPLNKHTEKLINKDLFDKMKDGVVFINTSRGGVVDEEELIKAVDSGKISYAGLDVLVEEYPDIENHPLNHRDNVVFTPHVAYYSRNSERDLLVFAGRSVKDYLLGKQESVSIVNR
ncbi:MAG: C-terminal binding protein [Tissierellaceae bacterium]